MSGPLEGLVVVDASWGMPSAVASMMLADYGATVIKVERPHRPGEGDSNLRKILDRGKWSTEIDLDTAEGKASLLELLGNADVFIESFGSGRADAMGIGNEDVRAKYPELIYTSITGYGNVGPLAERPGYEALLNARLGQTAEQRGHRDGPVFLGHPTVSYGTAFMAVIGILSALHARLQTGRGQHVDTSLLDGMMTISSMSWWWNEKDISYLARSGPHAGFGKTRLITDPFRCADGEWIVPHTGGPGSYKKLMDLLGFGDITPSIEGPEMTVPLSDEEYEVARVRVPEAFASRPRDEWLELLHANDIAALPVLQPEQTLEDPQVLHADLVAELEDDRYGKIRAIGPVIRLAKTPPRSPHRAPKVGEHNDRLDAVRRDGKWQAKSGNEAPDSALSGIKIVDFSSFFATGFGARLLCDQGADVIKIEPLVGDQMRPLGDLYEASQRGKRNIAIDMRTPEGQEVARRLVAEADVVMINYRPGKAEKIGLGYEQLREINPNLIYAYLPGFGSTGPKAKLKSFAPLQSALVGLPFIGAGEGNEPIRRVLGNEDLYNGFLGATAVLLALAHRAATGEGQYVESPQLHSSLFVRSEFAVSESGEPVRGHQLDAQQMGLSPLYRFYRTSDGWVIIAVVGDVKFAALATALNAPELLADERFANAAARARHAGELAEVLESRFAALDTATAFGALDKAGVPIEIPSEHPLMPEILWEEWATESGRVVEHHHPEYGWCREVGVTVRLSDTPARFRGPSASLGQHTREILAELGYADDVIEDMMAGVCRTKTPVATSN